MDIPQVLAVLRPGQDWGSSAQSDATYPQLVAGWRGTDPVPTLAEMTSTWNTLEANRPATVLTARRAAAASLATAAEAVAQLERAALMLTMDELNILRAQLVNVVTTAAWNPASLANGAELASPAFTIPGALFGDSVTAEPLSISRAGLAVNGYVSAADTVVVRLRNGTGGAVDLASSTWRVAVYRAVATPARTAAQIKPALLARISTPDAD